MSTLRTLAVLALLSSCPIAVCADDAGASHHGTFQAGGQTRQIIDAIAYQDRYAPGHARLVFSDTVFDREALLDNGQIDLTDFLHHPGAMLDLKITPEGVIDVLMVSADEHTDYEWDSEKAGNLSLDRRDDVRISGRFERSDLHRIEFDLQVLGDEDGRISTTIDPGRHR